MYPETTIAVLNGCPNAKAAEEIIAKDFAAVCWIVLEPLEIHFAHATDGMLFIFVILAEVELEVAVLPIGIVDFVVAITIPIET